MEAFGLGVLDLQRFYFTGEDYRCRFELEAKRRFLDLLRELFNLGVRYNQRALRWHLLLSRRQWS
jgi:hypothetical protein